MQTRIGNSSPFDGKSDIVQLTSIVAGVRDRLPTWIDSVAHMTQNLLEGTNFTKYIKWFGWGPFISGEAAFPDLTRFYIGIEDNPLGFTILSFNGGK